MPDDLTFDTWAGTFTIWKRESVSFLSDPLPTDDATGIAWEYQNLPRLYSEAGRHEALSAHFYYHAKNRAWADVLLGRAKDPVTGEPIPPQPKSSCMEIAKTMIYQEMLFMEEAKNLREDLRNRGFKIEQIKKHLEGPISGY